MNDSDNSEPEESKEESDSKNTDSKNSDSKNSDSESDDLKTSMSMVRDAQANDGDAWSLIVNTYSPLIQHWCCIDGIKRDEVSDCCQEVLMRALRRLPCFQKKKVGDSFRAWLRRITQIVVKDYYRQKKKGKIQFGVGGSSAVEAFTAVPRDDDESFSSNLLQNERYLLAQRVMDRIKKEFSPKQTKAFFGVVLEQRLPADVAEELDTSVNNVYKAKCRILAKVRKLFPEQTDSDKSGSDKPNDPV